MYLVQDCKYLQKMSTGVSRCPLPLAPPYVEAQPCMKLFTTFLVPILVSGRILDWKERTKKRNEMTGRLIKGERLSHIDLALGF